MYLGVFALYGFRSMCALHELPSPSAYIKCNDERAKGNAKQIFLHGNEPQKNVLNIQLLELQFDMDTYLHQLYSVAPIVFFDAGLAGIRARISDYITWFIWM